MKCPKCGSQNVTSQAISETTTKGKTKGFGWIKSCLGFLLFNIPGILCGLCGMGKSKTKQLQGWYIYVKIVAISGRTSI